MDRPLDDMIVERQGRSRASGRGRARRDGPRDGVRKPASRSDSRDMNSNWVHDRFDDDSHSRRRNDSGRDRRYDSHDRERDTIASGKLRVENVHYELTEVDLRGLFGKIGPVEQLEILYDKQDRSRGIAYVTYKDSRDASDAIREFDGAHAMGQPIRLVSVPAGGRRRGDRNPFDSIDGPPPRSIFDRIEDPGYRRERHARSASPRSNRMIDSYVPGERRSRSPPRRRGAPGRRPGQRREEGGRRGDRRGGAARDADGRPIVGGRPRKTADELDAEMDDYFTPTNGGENPSASVAAEQPVAAAEPVVDMDDMMIE